MHNDDEHCHCERKRIRHNGILLVSPFKTIYIIISKLTPYLIISTMNLFIILLLSVTFLDLEIKGNLLY